MLEELTEDSEESLNSLEVEFKEAKTIVKDKLDILGKRIEDCIIEEIKKDFINPFTVLLTECVGLNYDILTREFDDMMLDVIVLFKQITLDLLEPFKEGNEDCISYFITCFDFITSHDFEIVKGFNILERKSVFYVPNPKIFRDFMEITLETFEKWDVFLGYMLNVKKEIKEMLKERLRKRELALKQLFEQQKEHHLEKGTDTIDPFIETEASEENFMNEFDAPGGVPQKEEEEEDWENEESESTERTEFSSEQSDEPNPEEPETKSNTKGSDPNRFDGKNAESASSNTNSKSSETTPKSKPQSDEEAEKELKKDLKDQDEDLNPPSRSI
jgi:hypothetical protein